MLQGWRQCPMKKNSWGILEENVLDTNAGKQLA
jgi:hypothetical protein